MLPKENEEMAKGPPPIGGGPLGYGDPSDRRLRKTEKDIIIPKMIREEAKNRCTETVKVFVDCARNSGLLVGFKCKEEKKANNDCFLAWTNNPEFVKEITEKYIERRSYFRKTGEPVEKYDRRKS